MDRGGTTANWRATSACPDGASSVRARFGIRTRRGHESRGRPSPERTRGWSGVGCQTPGPGGPRSGENPCDQFAPCSGTAPARFGPAGRRSVLDVRASFPDVGRRFAVGWFVRDFFHCLRHSTTTQAGSRIYAFLRDCLRILLAYKDLANVGSAGGDRRRTRTFVGPTADRGEKRLLRTGRTGGWPMTTHAVRPGLGIRERRAL